VQSYIGLKILCRPNIAISERYHKNILAEKFWSCVTPYSHLIEDEDEYFRPCVTPYSHLITGLDDFRPCVTPYSHLITRPNDFRPCVTPYSHLITGLDDFRPCVTPYSHLITGPDVFRPCVTPNSHLITRPNYLWLYVAYLFLIILNLFFIPHVVYDTRSLSLVLCTIQVL